MKTCRDPHYSAGVQKGQEKALLLSFQHVLTVLHFQGAQGAACSLFHFPAPGDPHLPSPSLWACGLQPPGGPTTSPAPALISPRGHPDGEKDPQATPHLPLSIHPLPVSVQGYTMETHCGAAEGQGVLEDFEKGRLSWMVLRSYHAAGRISGSLSRAHALFF